MLFGVDSGWKAAWWAVAVLGLVGCGEQSARTTEPLRVALPSQPGAALPIAWAHSDPSPVTIRRYVSGKRALLALLAGEADIASTGDVPVACQALERQDFVVVAVIGACDDEPRVLARRDHGIQSPADLRGKTIATQQHSAVHFFLHLFLLKHGVAETDVDLRFMKAEQLPEALASGDVAAYSMREPIISRGQELLPGQTVVFSAPGLYRRQELLVVRRDVLARRQADVAAVLEGLLATAARATEQPEWLALRVAPYLGEDEATTGAALRRYSWRVELPQSLVVSLEDEVRWAQQQGLGTGASPNLLTIIDGSPLRRLRPAAVTVIESAGREVDP